MGDDVRAVLLPGGAQLGVPREVPVRRPALQRLRLRALDPLRGALHQAERAGEPARGEAVRLPHAEGAPQSAARAARGGGDRDPVRAHGARGEADVRVGARAAPAELRRARRRAALPGPEGRGDGQAAGVLQVAPRREVQLQAEEHEADAGAALLARLPQGVPQVQRTDLGLPLDAGGALRAARGGTQLRRAPGALDGVGRALQADAPGRAEAHALPDADDGGGVARVREALPGVRDHLRQPALDARRGERHPRQRLGAALRQARRDRARGAAVPGRHVVRDGLDRGVAHHVAPDGAGEHGRARGGLHARAADPHGHLRRRDVARRPHR
ncbi:MAG: hypothetical protein AVDCRST_MAG11-2226 [uncultured Gemmatimonadaceae bacterium]|uniref:Uncharacterized protein n=1 Tax=uncultured Gemmatimonadaceae bacterium TaxID=246130 RepID=A0A6J4L8V0_9BACT|nr:MAG: hypothetical protein AVDCRST_MAG11-2226 [uncultured Gemmatimonadaceae bacterium]